MDDKEQIGFEFGERKLKQLSGQELEEAFAKFHKENPRVWRLFREETLEAINRGEAKLRAHNIMKRVSQKAYVDYRFTRLYQDLFTGNHQELAQVFAEENYGDETQGAPQV
jgi:hypothetical protein